MPKAKAPSEEIVTVASLIIQALSELDETDQFYQHMKSVGSAVTKKVAERIAATGFRFSSDYRHGVTPLHELIYALVSTVEANYLADELELANQREKVQE